MISSILRRAYHKSLQEPRKFYTNKSEFHAQDRDPELVFYFIHGLGGAPGQAELLLPALRSILQRPFYLRAMHIPELDVHKPFAKRYQPGTQKRIREKIGQDLSELVASYPGKRIIITVSSHGMYDFVSAYPDIAPSIRARLVLCWLSCASDEYDKLQARFHRLLRLLYVITGYREGGYRWSFGINHDRLTFLNPEVSATFKTVDKQGEPVTYYKRDIEMRFKCLGIQWTDPTSVSFIRDYQAIQLSGFKRITDIKCFALAALNDGYWYDPSPDNIRRTVGRYVSECDISFVDTSHLWCVTPPMAEPFLRRFFARLPEYDGRDVSGLK